jgi:hypothetical protein
MCSRSSLYRQSKIRKENTTDVNERSTLKNRSSSVPPTENFRQLTSTSKLHPWKRQRRTKLHPVNFAIELASCHSSSRNVSNLQNSIATTVGVILSRNGRSSLCHKRKADCARVHNLSSLYRSRCQSMTDSSQFSQYRSILFHSLQTHHLNAFHSVCPGAVT